MCIARGHVLKLPNVFMATTELELEGVYERSNTSSENHLFDTTTKSSTISVDKSCEEMEMMKATNNSIDIQFREDGSLGAPKEKRFKEDSEASTSAAFQEGERTESMSLRESVNLCAQQIADATRDVHNKWRETFRESESFEAISIKRVEALLKEACALREKLELQKQSLIARLKRVTSILEKTLPSE